MHVFFYKSVGSQRGDFPAFFRPLSSHFFSAGDVAVDSGESAPLIVGMIIGVVGEQIGSNEISDL